MDAITVFLDRAGRPLGMCPAGGEARWLLDAPGDYWRLNQPARQVASTEQAFADWEARQAAAGHPRPVLPW